VAPRNSLADLRGAALFRRAIPHGSVVGEKVRVFTLRLDFTLARRVEVISPPR